MSACLCSGVFAGEAVTSGGCLESTWDGVILSLTITIYWQSNLRDFVNFS